MTEQPVAVCAPVDISDEDIYEAMRDIQGYLDITPGDFKEVYLKAFRHAIERLTRGVKAEEVMTRDVAHVTRQTPLKDVARIMAVRGVSGVPVLESDSKVAGVISEKDFLAAMGARVAKSIMEVVAQCLGGNSCLAAPSRAKSAEDIMNRPAVTVGPETPVIEVADILTRNRINRVPVVDSDGHLIGIVSRADVVRWSTGLEAR